MLVRLQPPELLVLVEQPGVLATLSRWRSRVRIPPGTLAGTVRKPAKRPSSNLGDRLWVRFPPVLLTGHVAGWALASPTACKAAAFETVQVQLLHDPLTARSSIGIGYRPLNQVRRVRFPHGLLNMTKWWNWKTRDAQNVVPQGLGVRLSPWSLDIAGAAGVQLAFIGRCARFDTGACNCG